MLMGLFIYFYIIFGTNLLTQGRVQIVVFAYFSVSQKRNIKWNPNVIKPSGELFLERKQSRRLGVHVREETRKARGREARPHPHGPLVAPLTDFLRLYISSYPETIEEHHEKLFPPLQPSVSVRSHLGAFDGAPPDGETAMEGLSITTKASPMSCE